MSEEQSGPSPTIGQLWIARSDRGAELQVLVVEVHDGHVQALLCDEECDQATETDAVLSPITTGLPRRLLVHGDVSASILTRRLSRAVARIDGIAQEVAFRLELQSRRRFRPRNTARRVRAIPA